MAKNKDDIIEVDGLITELLPNQFFRVELDNGHIVTAYTSGKIKKFKIRLVEGDRVKLEMSVYDMNKGRVVYRYQVDFFSYVCYYICSLTNKERSLLCVKQNCCLKKL